MSIARQFVNIHRTFLNDIESNSALADIALVPSDRFSKSLPNFCQKYYGNERTRVLVLGINPGRRGSGITGVPFCDGATLAEFGIPSQSYDSRETTSQFMKDVINAYGGPTKFFEDFILSALFPIGLAKQGKNLNYYDLPIDIVKPLAEKSLKEHSMLDVRKHVIVIGSGKNLKFIQTANKDARIFDGFSPLEHPRFIEQYNRTNREYYIEKYLAVLNKVSTSFNRLVGPGSR